MKKYVLFLVVLAFIFCGGGENNSLVEQHDHQGELSQGVEEGAGGEEAEHEHLELQVPLEKQKEWGIGLETVSTKAISMTLDLPGVLKVNQNRTAHISSYVQGKVVSLPADLGDRIRLGQTLMIINSPEFARAQADFLQSRAEYLLGKKEYERAKMLREEKAIEEKEYLRREEIYENLATKFGALGSALHSYGLNHDQIDELIEKCKLVKEKEYKCEIADPNLPILSPIAGTVIFRDVMKGEQVDTDKILYTVSDLSTLWAILDVYEKDLPYIRKDSPVAIFTSIYPEKRFSGKITTISDIIDEKLRTVKIRVEVDNSEKLLKPNMYVQGKIENRLERNDLLVIPEEAIQNWENEKIVFVSEEGDVFAACHVGLGNRVGEDRIILAGLQEGDRIVVRGAFYLKAEMSKATFGHTHVH